MKRRLLVSFLTLVVIVLMALEIPLGLLTAQREREHLSSAAQRDAAALAVVVQEELEHPGTHDLANLASQYRASTGAEVAVLDAAGNTQVALDPNEVEPKDDDVLLRSKEALSGRTVTFAAVDEGKPVQVAAVPVRQDLAVRGAVVVSIPASAAERTIRVTWLALAGLAVGVIAVSVGMGLWLATSVTEPLAELGATTARLGHGDLDARATESGPVEVRDLAASFNEMAERLSELVSAQRRFVADASHQLRTPLTALRLRLENLEVATDDASSADLAAAELELGRLSRLVDGLLALSRAEGQRPEREVVDIQQVVDDRLAAWSPLADERGVQLCASTAGDGATATQAWLVPGHLEQILDNLLANALEATPAGCSITVGVAHPDGRVEVHVRDEGPGMSDSERARAFDRFWQGAGNGGGSGLGLAIVRQLARSSGGDVELQPAAGGGLDAAVRLQPA